MNQTRSPSHLGNKILIIGCAGSGKTTLSKRLSIATGLPIIHMDRHFWKKNWVRTADEEWFTVVADLCKQPAWIMDGNYSKLIPLRLSHASAVIFLDMPRWKCLLRVVLRRFRFIHNKRRDDIPTHCKERMSLAFYQWIWHYPKRSRPQIIAQINSFHGTVHHIRSSSDLHQLHSSLPHQGETA